MGYKMKLQPTCSICLSKIKIIDLRIGSRRMGPGRKLQCNHVFHASCIDAIYKPVCPLCEHPIFNRDEEALLSCTSKDVAVGILNNLHEHDINVKNVFTFLTSGSCGSSKKYQWIVELMYKYCDFTELLADNLNDKNLVNDIVVRGKVNWFKTFCGGLTFSDLVYERTDDPEIIALVHTKLPIDRQNISDIKRPITASPPPPVPQRRHRKRRISDALEGATSERSLYPSLYPSLVEELKPSAPPIELMS